jgi:hypothetical protein
MIPGHRRRRPAWPVTLPNKTRHTIAVANANFPQLFLEGTNTQHRKIKAAVSGN